MLASEDVNAILLIIYPVVDSAHGAASAFLCVCEKILGDFHQNP